jgi:superfamily II DNA or RNA helicase
VKRRLFNLKEKFRLRWFFRDRCARCGSELGDDWQADHKTPWSKGGETKLYNAQPLCKKCNLQKGNRMERADLRIWQQEAFEECLKAINNGKKDFLACASVGAGKTKLACEVARKFLEQGNERRGIIIVTNSRNLVQAWEGSGSEAGLNLKCAFGNSEIRQLPRDVDGYVFTYAALGQDPPIHEIQTASRPTMVIFDEIHHLEEGDEKTPSSVWCGAAQQAFGQAEFRLALSGTPFRSNGNRIPFIHYEATEIAGEYQMIPDFNYPYGKAVADGICRRVSFHTYGGTIEYRIDAEEFRVTFDDDLDDIQKSRRLEFFNKASVDNLLLGDLFEQAASTLCSLRENADPAAGGLIIAHDKRHARELREFLMRTTGESGEVVLSDDEEGDAQAKIELFKNDGRRKWLIAVRMISEGVDIPRLRVLVYCSRITEELFFIQAMGRIVRMGKTDVGGVSHMFVPGDQRFKTIIARVEDEVERAIIERDKDSEERKRDSNGEALEHIKEFISAQGSAENPVTGGIVFDAWTLKKAEESLPLFPGKDILQIAEIIESLQPPSKERMKKDPGLSWDKENRRLRILISDKVRVHAQRRGCQHNEVWNRLKERCGISLSRPQESLSNEELECQLKEIGKIIYGR